MELARSCVEPIGVFVWCSACERSSVVADPGLATKSPAPESNERVAGLRGRAEAGVLAQRREILAAFVAKHGCGPEDLIQVTETIGQVTRWWVERKAEVRVQPATGTELHDISPGSFRLPCRGFSPSDSSFLARLGGSARRAMDVANRESFAMGHDFLGTEHLLLGLITVPGWAEFSMKNKGLTADSVREQVASLVRPNSGMIPAGKASLTPRVREAIAIAANWSAGLPIFANDLLDAIIQDAGGIGYQILVNLGYFNKSFASVSISDNVVSGITAVELGPRSADIKAVAADGLRGVEPAAVAPKPPEGETWHDRERLLW